MKWDLLKWLNPAAGGTHHKERTSLYDWLFRIGSVVFIGYLVFLTGQAIFQNYKTREKIETLESKIAELQGENQTLENLNLYYQTDSFKELEARRKLFYRKPGEKVIDVTVPKREEQPEPAKSLLAQSTKEEKEELDQRSNPEKWLDFVLKR